MQKFYLLVVGSRTFNDYSLLKEHIDFSLQKRQESIVIVSGGAKGADLLAKRYAEERGYEYVEFLADWELHGKSAGYIRNDQMHKFISQFDNRGVIAFWDGKSKGTEHNFSLAEKYNNRLILIQV